MQNQEAVGAVFNGVSSGGFEGGIDTPGRFFHKLDTAFDGETVHLTAAADDEQMLQRGNCLAGVDGVLGQAVVEQDTLLYGEPVRQAGLAG